VGKRRSVRTAAQQQSESDAGSRISQQRSTKGKAKAQRRVPVTALIVWPTFHSQEWDRRSTNRWQHRLKREHPTCTERITSLLEECGWKGGDSGGDSAEKKPCPTKERQNRLDSDRPSHGRRFHSKSQRGRDFSAPVFWLSRADNMTGQRFSEGSQYGICNV
jgi:hypothetical protein